MTQLDDANAAALLFSPAVADDPHPTYARMRAECPVARSDLGGSAVAIISRYDDVVAALRHPDRFTSAAGMLGLGEQPLLPLEVDPPLHSSYRRILNPHFVPRRIEQLEPQIREAVTDLLDGFAARGSCDFHAEFATPLPSSIFLALMGLPAAELTMFLQWRDNTIRPAVEPGDWESAERIRRETAAAISSYFRQLIAERRAAPDDSLLSAIVHAEVDGRALDETELLGICHLLLLGGLDTVTATLDCMVAHLATHPEQRRQLADDPACIPSAVEELLRWLTPVMVVPRTVKVDTEVAGVSLAAGDGVALALGSANLDDQAFGPPDLDLHRPANKHVAFGAGAHLCLGAHLARLELRVALEELHQRVPDYRIAEGAEVHFSTGIRQADSLPLTFDPS